jgi:bacterioferritin-associated ferredoxin
VNNLIFCHCWDVSAKEIEDVIKEDVHDIEWIKRHTGLATGGCQGRWCLELAISWLREHYPEFDWSTLPTARQPLYPVQVWRLAGAKPEDEGI